jgi:hypothetical protein
VPGSLTNPFGMTEAFFDRKEQFDRIVQLLVPGESLWMVLDCKGGGTGYVGISDRRLIFQDANWRRTKNVLVSVPLDRIHAVGISSDTPLLGRSTAALSIQAGDDDWTFEFKNAEKTRNAYLLLMHLVLNRDANTPDTKLPALV